MDCTSRRNVWLDLQGNEQLEKTDFFKYNDRIAIRQTCAIMQQPCWHHVGAVNKAMCAMDMSYKWCKNITFKNMQKNIGNCCRTIPIWSTLWFIMFFGFLTWYIAFKSSIGRSKPKQKIFLSQKKKLRNRTKNFLFDFGRPTDARFGGNVSCQETKEHDKSSVRRTEAHLQQSPTCFSEKSNLTDSGDQWNRTTCMISIKLTWTDIASCGACCPFCFAPRWFVCFSK